MIDCMAGGVGPSSGALAGGLASVLLLPAGLGIALQTARARSARQRRSPQPPAEDPALTVLKERYARAEIDHDELDRRLHHLLSRSKRIVFRGGGLGQSSAAVGRVTTKRAPCPAPWLSARMRPPWAWTMARVIVSPIPLPPCSAWVRARSTR